jgi:hypothetical protein
VTGLLADCLLAASYGAYSLTGINVDLIYTTLFTAIVNLTLGIRTIDFDLRERDIDFVVDPRDIDFTVRSK